MLGFSLSAGQGLSGPIYRVDQVPENYQEHFIIRGYRRPKSSVIECLLSLFDATNETLNVWTHFLPFWYFVWIAYQVSGSFNSFLDPYSWPLLCYFITCCLFPIASASAHLFNVMSDEARHFCFFLDYSAVSLVSLGSAIGYRAYCFPLQLLADDGPYVWIRDNFVTIAIFNSLLCTFLACLTRFMKPSFKRQILRLSSFAVPYIYDGVPILYRLFYCTDEDCHLLSQNYLLRQFFLSVLSAFLFASHLPERLLPGSFDIVGHSHQLFHITSALGVLYQIQGILLDVKERKELNKSKLDFESFSSSIGTMLFTVTANGLIIAYLSFYLYRHRRHRRHVKTKTT